MENNNLKVLLFDVSPFLYVAYFGATYILNNMAVSLDLSLEDGVDGYSFLMSELKIRSRFEGKRGDRL